MPHKHTRKGEDKSNIDLPPSEIARPLPVSKSAAANGIFTTDLDTKRNNKKRKRTNKSAEDDTPRAFARLMAFQRGEKLPKGLDDGIRAPKKKQKPKAAEKDDDDNDDDTSSKKQKNTKSKQKVALEAAAAAQAKTEAVPTIRPGERMSDFAARVDAALPVSGLINKSSRGGKDPLGLKVHRTKTEKRMHRMYDEWREEERKIQDRKMEAMELAEEEQMDEDGQVKWKVDIAEAAAASAGGAAGGSGKNKKGKKGAAGKGGRKKVLGEVDDGNDDPWAKIVRDRAEVKAGLHDVVQAPPTFTKIPREKFKMLKTSGRGSGSGSGSGSGAGVSVGAQVDDVPRASGSLRRREELGDVRRSVVEGYRQMMKENRAKME